MFGGRENKSCSSSPGSLIYSSFKKDSAWRQVPSSLAAVRSSRILLAPGLTDGDTRPFTTPLLQLPAFNAAGYPRPMARLPLATPRACCPAPHRPGCTFAARSVLPTRRVGEAASRPERRAAEQNKRPLQQAQRVVRLPGAACRGHICAHANAYVTPAR